MKDHRELAIFDRAIELSPELREAYVLEACCGDTSLTTRMLRLLIAHEAPYSWFDLDDPSDADASTLTGSVVGERYRLLEKLGEGGFGVVYAAEQLEPVQRKVAVKILKAGMDSRQIVARFEQERQALAIMNHPGIAKILDGGVTDNERPFFVMELVEGPPITDFCRNAKLPVGARLQLVVMLCEAIHHAHSRGVIHRDLKPSNVLVALCDDHPVVKVIDFGVAKALRQPLIEAPHCTMAGQLIGTWEYMSPEQATLEIVDLDSRTDVYSVGVMLYELLTGTTPFDGARLRSVPLTESLRIIREEDPLKPSSVAQQFQEPQGEERQGAATLRPVDRRLLRGQLDCIALKALEKDRARRYQSMAELAADLASHLRNEPILAHPPSWMRRIARSIAKKRAAVRGLSYLTALTVGATGALLVLSNTTGSTPAAADLENIGDDGSIVNVVVIDAVEVSVIPSNAKLMTARTYEVGGAFQAFSRGGPTSYPNSPADSSRVSGARFISTVVVGNSDLKVATPLRFSFSRPVRGFGFTTLDLLEEGSHASEYVQVTAFDANGRVLSAHQRVGPQGPDGLDLDWYVKSAQTNIEYVTLESSLSTLTGYGIDDFVIDVRDLR